MIKLREIIWEITAKCNNNCDYCGSKDTTGGANTLDSDIKDIATEICAYPPEEVNISGGDPLLICYDTHRVITEKFKAAGIIPKVLCNPKSFNSNMVPNILDLYNVIGVSINTEDELSILQNKKYDLYKKTTIITNFNKSNLWLYDEIHDFVKKHDLTWQVQLTLYSEDDPNAIYKSDKAWKTLCNKLDNSFKHGHQKIVIADNMNSGTCTAGMNSIGILADGTVIPCLSMVSWAKAGECMAQGNLLKDSTLQEIWENEFKEQRFREGNRCCKDHCGNKCYNPADPRPSILDIFPSPESSEPYNPKGGSVMAYAVVQPNISIMYGVQTVTNNPDKLWYVKDDNDDGL